MPEADAVTIEAVRDALLQVMDPELGVDVVNLGLVRRIEADDQGLRVWMSATSAACPMTDLIAEQSQAAVAARLPGRGPVEVRLTWDPPWRPEDMSELARRTLQGPG